MAKKKKDDDDLNEEFGLGSSDDVNDADDNFGLPDVDIKPLDEAEENSAEEEVEQSASKQEETSEDSEIYRESYGSASSSESEYEAPKAESIAPKLILFAVLLIISAGLIWYFGFYSPAQKREEARIEQQRKADEEAAAAKRRAELEQQAREQARQDSIARAQAVQEAIPETGAMTTISARTGRYYVVIGSFIDDDIAKDFADKLGKDGVNTSLIPPWGERKFYRLAIADLGSFDEAQAKADEMKPTYGEGLWVLKY